MANELSWVGDFNHSVASQGTTTLLGRWEIWYLVESLLGTNTGGTTLTGAGLWTVVSSCDSLSTASSDLWGTTFNSAKVVQNTAGNAHSWFVLQSPSTLGASGSVYMIVDCNGATASPSLVQVSFCTQSPTGGSTTAAPTSPGGATDTWGMASALAINNNSIATNHRVHMCLATTGDFYFRESSDAAGAFYSMLGITKMQSAHAADLYPAICIFSTGLVMNTNANVNTFLLWTNATTSNTSNLSGTGNTTLRGRSYNGGASPAMMIPGMAYSRTNATPESFMTGSSAANTGANESDGTYNFWYVPVFQLGANAELKGRLADVGFASGSLAQISVVPSAQPFNYVKQGDLWWPWPATVAPSV